MVTGWRMSFKVEDVRMSGGMTGHLVLEREEGGRLTLWHRTALLIIRPLKPAVSNG